MPVGRMSSGSPGRLPTRVPLPANALAGTSRGLSPNRRTTFRASLVERLAVRLRMGFFAAGRLACTSVKDLSVEDLLVADLATRCSGVARAARWRRGAG